MPFSSLLHAVRSLHSTSPWQDTGCKGNRLEQLRLLGKGSSHLHLHSLHHRSVLPPHGNTLQPLEKLCTETRLLGPFMRLPKATPTASQLRSITPPTTTGPAFCPSLLCLELHQSRSSEPNAMLCTVGAQNTGLFLECPVLFGDLCLSPEINERNSPSLDFQAVLWDVCVTHTKATVAGFRGYVSHASTRPYLLFFLSAILGIGKKNCCLPLPRATWPWVASGDQMRQHCKALEEGRRLTI